MATLVVFTKNTIKPNVYAKVDSDTTVVGVSLPSQETEHMNKLNNSLLSCFISFNYEVIICDAQNDAYNQKIQIENLISQSVDAIVVMPVDEDSLITVLNSAYTEGIIIIVIGSTNNSYPPATYVDFDYSEAAYKDATDFLDNHWVEGKESSILVVHCDNSHGTIYFKTIRDTINERANKEEPTISINEIRISNVNEVNSKIRDFIRTNDNHLPDAIFVCCGDTTQEVKLALHNAGFVFGPDGIPLYGFKNCSHNYDNMAKRIAQLIQSKLNGESVPENTVILIEICNSHNDS